MTNDERIKIQRLIKSTNTTMIKLFEYDNHCIAFKKFLSDNQIFLDTLKMTNDQFVEETKSTNTIYKYYTEVQPLTTFMIAKAMSYDLFIKQQDKYSFFIEHNNNSNID